MEYAGFVRVVIGFPVVLAYEYIARPVRRSRDCRFAALALLAFCSFVTYNLKYQEIKDGIGKIF